MNATPLIVVTALCLAFSLAIFFVRERAQRPSPQTNPTAPDARHR